MAGIFGDGQRGGIFGAKVDPRLLAKQRIAEAFAASEGMQEPSQALYAAKHRRAQEYLGNEPPPPELSWEDFASLGPRALGGAQKMWQAAPAALGALYEDPLGTINRVGQVGQAATDAIVRGAPTPFTQFGDPNVDPAKQGADLALAAMGGSAAVPAEANSLRMGIKAYHGSPHDFERFDASKIGTGEGAQAYGHGMYFAEREGVAKEYRDALSRNQKKWLVDGEHVGTYGENSTPLGSAAANIRGVKGSDGIVTAEDAAKAIEHFEGVHQRNKGMLPKEHIAATVKEMRGLVGRNVSEDVSGKMYEVDIAAKPEHFLDWDKPLSEQPKAIQDAMVTPEASALRQQLDEVEAQKSALAADRLPSNQMREEKRWFELAREADRLQGELSKVVTADMKGGFAYGRTSGGGAPASQSLREAGIPGIRYLDQGSRDPQKMKELADDLAQYREAAKHWAATGNTEKLAIAQKQIEVLQKRVAQTSNYVVFDDKLISILRKYGLPISAAGLAALSQLHPQEAQAAQKQKGR